MPAFESLLAAAHVTVEAITGIYLCLWPNSLSISVHLLDYSAPIPAAGCRHIVAALCFCSRSTMCVHAMSQRALAACYKRVDAVTAHEHQVNAAAYWHCSISSQMLCCDCCHAALIKVISWLRI